MTEVTEIMLSAGAKEFPGDGWGIHRPHLAKAYLAMEAARIPAPAPDVERYRKALEEIQRYAVKHWGWVFYVQRLATEALADHAVEGAV